MFSKWIDESEFDGKNDFFDNSVMSVRQWLAVMSVMIIPVVNVVMIFWWAFAEKELTNSNKVNWARASVILLTAFVIAVALLGGILLFGWYIHEKTHYDGVDTRRSRRDNGSKCTELAQEVGQEGGERCQERSGT